MAKYRFWSDAAQRTFEEVLQRANKQYTIDGYSVVVDGDEFDAEAMDTGGDKISE